MHFDLVDLRLLVNIADFNSLTRTADATHMSLSAVSTRVKKLEDSIGIQLIYRTGQGVALTPTGLTFAMHARLVLRQIQHLRGDLQEYAKGVKGHLRVFANTTALVEFLPPILQAYLASHPDVNIDLHEKPSRDIVRAVADGQTDIGIVAGNVSTRDLEVIPYRSDRLVLVTPPGHALAQAGAVDFADTLEYDHVSLHEASALHTFLHEASDALHRSLQIRIQVGNFEAACRMIAADIGVGILPESAARRYAQNTDIAIVPLNDKWAVRAMKICVRNLEELPAFAKALIVLLAADAEKAGAEDGSTGAN
ncbi:LysR substrate-binding domain-containing protein [Herbaspirillum rhizosphaerae]|uniref:LysR family transcriptional regulator n=1 Tax=Herbaspirillum rhizosphaerae TaxID=346179 RepID=UPI00067C94D3|nr:LysR substrate-binding domain-containing protein [Herbaspirillum rhizosphaerae]